MSQFLSLRVKSMAAFCCVACITAIVGITGFVGMKKLDGKFNEVIESAPLIQTAINMKLMVSKDIIIVYSLMAALDTDELAEKWKVHLSLAEQFDKLKKAVLDGATLENGVVFAAEDQELRAIVKHTADYHSKIFLPSFALIYDQMGKKLAAENYDYNLLDTIDEKTIEIGKQLDLQLSKVVTYAKDVIVQAEKDAQKTKALAAQVTTITMILGILAAIVLGFVFSAIVAKPVVRAAKFTKIVAEGDFTQSMKITQKDEIGDMVAAINTMVESMAGIFKDISGGVGTLTQTATELADISLELKDHALDMSESSEAVTTSAEELKTRLSSVASLSQESSSNLDAVSSAVEEMTATVNEIAKNTGEARIITGTAVEKAKSASEKVNELGIDAKEIGQVTDVIGEISEQTNLLALNATIEAARAGEAGKGFAVVASEIKDLANQTAEAAKNIKLKIDRIQKSTAGTVVEIEEISRVINDVDSIVSSIASAVEEQSITSQEIASNIAHAAAGIRETDSHISESSAASVAIADDVSSVNENSGKVAASSKQLTDNVQKLNDFALRLKNMLSRFKL
ncbi:MAG: methyl-accepting chemotaxis protein [Pseudomonadota bacterium]